MTEQSIPGSLGRSWLGAHFVWQRLYFVAQKFVVKKTGMEPFLVPPQPSVSSCCWCIQDSSRPMELLIHVVPKPPEQPGCPGCATAAARRCPRRWGGDSSLVELGLPGLRWLGWWQCLVIRAEIPGEAGGLCKGCRAPCRGRVAFLASQSVMPVLAWEGGDLHEDSWCSDLGFSPYFAMSEDVGNRCCPLLAPPGLGRVSPCKSKL